MSAGSGRMDVWGRWILMMILLFGVTMLAMQIRNESTSIKRHAAEIEALLREQNDALHAEDEE